MAQHKINSNRLFNAIRMFILFCLIKQLDPIHAQWTSMSSQTTGNVRGVIGTSSDHVFAIDTYAGLLHFNGDTWRKFDSAPRATAVWCSPDQEVYVIGYYDIQTGINAYRWNGSDWLPVGGDYSLEGSFFDLWGTPSGHLWTVGCRYENHTMTFPQVASFDGNEWTSVVLGLTEGIMVSVWGFTPDDIYAVGYHQIDDAFTPAMFHFDGSQWKQTDFDVPSGQFFSVWGTSGGNVYVAGESENAPLLYHYDGQSWTRIETDLTFELRDVWGTSETNIYVTGKGGGVARFNGTQWLEMSSQSLKDINSCWQSSSGVLHAVGYGVLLIWDGAAWERQTMQNCQYLVAVHGTPGQDVFTAGYGDGSLLRWAGDEWIDTAVDQGSIGIRLSIWGSSGSDMFSCGQGLSRWDGTTWTEMVTPLESGTQFQAVWGSSSEDVFAVTHYLDSRMIHFDGTSWTVMDIGSDQYNFRGICGSSASDVYAYGYDTLIHFDGNSWSPVDTGPSNWVTSYDLYCIDSDDVYGVGSPGYVVHYDGSEWSKIQVADRDLYLYGIWGSRSDDVYAVGLNGRILHFNGFEWSAISSGTMEHLSDISGNGAGDIFALGYNGTILHHSDSESLGVQIEMSSVLPHSGDVFRVKTIVSNPGQSLTNIHLFFFLDVYGTYYFWPSWSEFDSVTMDVPSGRTPVDILEFTWPETPTSDASGLNFWSAMVNESMSQVIGSYAVIEWRYK